MAAIDHQQPIPLQNSTSSQERHVLDSITRTLSGLNFGSIEIVVHEGKVTQIERKEKIRI